MPFGLLFEVQSILGKRIRITEAYWNYISKIKRPSLQGLEREVRNSLIEPNEVRMNRRDPDVYLYYGKTNTDLLVCCVVKHLNGAGYIITAYLTRRMVGELTWKSS
jgi:hypothetical protein